VFKRRRHVNRWPVSQLVRQVDCCVASDPEQREVHAVIVLHQDPDLLPKDAAKWAQEAAGDPREQLAEYVMFGLFFEEIDREALYMDGDPACLVKMIDGLMNQGEARDAAREWVGPTAQELPFHQLPGIYQTAFVKHVVGYQADLDALEMAWYLPGGNGLSLVRDFPPRLGPSPITPEPGRVSWAMMPSAAVEEMFRQRGF
jgi:hypothetical protein